MIYYLFFTKRTNGEYYIMIGHTTINNEDEIKDIVLSNRNDYEVSEIIQMIGIEKTRYDDMSNTYTVYDMGNIDFEHIDNPDLEYEFIERTINKYLNNTYDKSRKYPLITPALENYPIDNKTLTYYLKVYIEHIMQAIFRDDVEFKLTFFNVNVYRDNMALCGFGYNFKVTLTIKTRNGFVSYKTNMTADNVLGDNEYYDIRFVLGGEFTEYVNHNPYIDNTYEKKPQGFLRGTHREGVDKFLFVSPKNDDNIEEYDDIFNPITDILNRHTFFKATDYSNYYD